MRALCVWRSNNNFNRAVHKRRNSIWSILSLPTGEIKAQQWLKTEGPSGPHSADGCSASVHRNAGVRAGAGAHTSSLGSKLSSSLNAVPTRLLTWGGFSPMPSGYSFGILPVISCGTEQSRQDDGHWPELSNTIWRAPRTEDTHSLPQTDLLKLLDFFQELFLQQLFLLLEFQDFLSLLLLTNFRVLRTWGNWKWGREGLSKRCFLPF